MNCPNCEHPIEKHKENLGCTVLLPHHAGKFCTCLFFPKDIEIVVLKALNADLLAALVEIEKWAREVESSKRGFLHTVSFYEIRDTARAAIQQAEATR